MSLFGSLKTGVSGLTAQSSAMSIISDNIANSSTVGYKAGSASFSTLVTKQTSSTRYASGGVQCRTRTGIDAQGLLSTSTRSTDIAVSGNGFFVTTTAANPDVDDMFSYTRAGSFEVDNNGYLKNANGYYLQAWSLQTYDGAENASLVQVGDQMFMKAYTDNEGTTVYVNDNIIDSDNLKPVNLNTIGGSAQETLNIRFGANLPADAPVYKSETPEEGGRYSSAVLMYDSLGNSHNATLTFTKTGPSAWDIDMEMPSGAATLISYCSGETTNDKDPDVYAARAQLEFNSIPTNHSFISMETNGTNYVFEFTTDITTYSAKPNEVVIPVDLSAGIITVSDAVEKFYEAVSGTMPGADRFYLSASGTTVRVAQSTAGAAVHFNASKCAAVAQSVTNPNPATNIPTGEFDLPEIDWDIKNGARIEFTSTLAADYIGKSIIVGDNTYLFATTSAQTSNGVVTVNISDAIDRASGKVDTVKLVSLLKGKIYDTEPDFQRYVASGSTLEINPIASGAPMLVASGNATSVTFQNTNLAAYIGQTVTIGDTDNNLQKKFEFLTTPGIVSGTVLASGNIAVNISDLVDLDMQDTLPDAVMNSLYNTIQLYYDKNPSIDDLTKYFRVSASTIVSTTSFLSTTASATTQVKEQSLTFTRGDATDYVGNTVTVNGTTYTFTKFGITSGTNVDITDAIYSQSIDFTGANPADGETIVIGDTTYEFDNDANVAAGHTAVAIGATDADTVANLAAALGLDDPGAPILYLTGDNIQFVDASGTGAVLTESVGADSVMSLFATAIGKESSTRGPTMTLRRYGTDPFTATTTDQPDPSTLETEALITSTSTAGVGNVVSIVGKDNGKQSNQPNEKGLIVVNNTFYYNNVEDAQSGSKIAGVRFNSDGTPKEINIDKVSIEWANGARDMTGNFYESSQISLYLGDKNTANGLTQLAGNYATNFITQDGAKFGNYTGVSVSEDGIVTAIFDNGETRPIAQIPLATFVDPNSMESLNGNAWIETTASGYATLCTAGESGAGIIAGGSLEDSTVDIAEEFTNMIQVQRAYSASSKIITTASDMLEELMNIKR